MVVTQSMLADAVRQPDSAPTGDQHVVMWPPASEFILRATSATSVGDPEPASDLLDVG